MFINVQSNPGFDIYLIILKEVSLLILNFGLRPDIWLVFRKSSMTNPLNYLTTNFRSPLFLYHLNHVTANRTYIKILDQNFAFYFASTYFYIQST